MIQRDIGDISFSLFRIFLSWASLIVGFLGLFFSFLVFKISYQKQSILSAAGMMLLNGLTLLAGTLAAITIIPQLQLHQIQKSEAENAKTNIVHLAYLEFESNETFYTGKYLAAVTPLKNFQDTHISSLRSKELLKARGSKLSAFVGTGEQLKSFFIGGPATFNQRIEHSGLSTNAIKRSLNNFNRHRLNQWKEQYSVVDKTVQMMSYAWVLNDLLLSNFDHWHITNDKVAIDDQLLAKELLAYGYKVRQLKKEQAEALKELENHQAKSPD